MRNLKRVLSLALALVMVLGMMVITTSAADFTDAEEITYTEAVDVMSALGILKGYEAADGTFTFNPKGTLTRAEAAKILAFVCLGAGADEYLTGSAAAFEDVKVTNWAAKYVAFCKNAKIINGVNEAQTLFNPNGTLKTVEFAKMLLCAIEFEGVYTGEGWENNVKSAAKKAGLNVITIDTTEITREEACEMALAAMKYSPVADTWELKKDDVTIKTYEDAVEAAMAAAVLGGKDAGYTVALAEGEGSLLQTVYGVKYGTSPDKFGRDTIVYTNIKTGKAVITLAASEAAYVYTQAVKADDLAVDLKGLKAAEYEIGADVKADATIAKLVQDNGDEKALTIDKDKALEDAIAKLTGDHTTVEIYVADGAISNIVVIDTNYDTVKVVKATEKKAAHILIGAAKYEFETTGYEDGDYVAYTKAGSKVQSVEKLDSFTAQLNKFNKDEYTIGGEVYEVTGDVAAKIKGNAKAYLSEAYVYYVGNNGIIVAVEPVDGPEEVKVTDYLKVLNAGAESKTGLLQQVPTWETAVVVLLPDGKTATYELALTTKDGVTTIGKLGTELETDGKGIITALIGNYYTYTVADGVLTLEAPKTDLVAIKTALTVPTVGEYIVNSDTTIILCVKNDKGVVTGYKTVKGLAAAEDSVITGDAVVRDVTNAKNEVIAKVVDVIFAEGCAFQATQTGATGTETYVYYDKTYEVGYDAVKKEPVYTATVTKADGTTVNVVVAGTEAKGVYELQDNNTLGKAVSDVKVKAAAGDMYVLNDGVNDSYVTVNASTKVLVVAEKAALEVGAKVVVFVDKAGVATEIFVVEAAPKA